YAGPRPVHLIVGINRDKDARAVLRPLLRVATSVCATQAQRNVRALPAAELARWCRQLGKPAEVSPGVADALRSAPPGVVCVTGSLLLVGQARDALGLPVPERLWG
ncbi:MAG: bifunctional folylpolyglutamate synthase/dihydrofolate synthase, partial [Chloroflexota bacterium]|nr:bifunctional folylpolyglutamate synthase/dihydrofolate synthase [Chloroflexota bacterium]